MFAGRKLYEEVLGTAGYLLTVAHALVWMYRKTAFPVFRRLLSEHILAWRLARKHVGQYNVLSDAQLRQRKRSDRVFVFGSGASLNEIPDAEWARIARDDTIGFNGTHYLKKIFITYFVLRAGTETIEAGLAWRGDVDEIVSAIDNNPYLDDTVFFFQRGLTGIFCNRLLGFHLWKKERPLRFFLNDKIARFPYTATTRRLVHRAGTLCTATNLAVALGYKEIVLTGVDLYDNRYFWLAPDETMGWSAAEQKWTATRETVHGATVSSQHNTVRNGIVQIMGDWQRRLAKEHGIKLTVYNPRSLLTEAVPIFQWPESEVGSELAPLRQMTGT
jgi:hypothetical protein